jgi:thymidine kinase
LKASCNTHIIHSEIKTGKTTKLIELSKFLKEIGYKVFFVSNFNYKRHNYEFCDDYRNINQTSDIRLYKTIKETLIRDYHDVLLIDDIDYSNNDLYKYIFDMDIIKIFTCDTSSLETIKSKIDNFKLYDFNSLKQLIRDFKLEKLIK